MKFIVPLLLVVSAALAGCAGDTEPQFVVPAQDDQGRYVIQVGPQGALIFRPANAVVPEGATVFFDALSPAHNVKSETGAFPKSELNEDYVLRLSQNNMGPGDYPYVCEPHIGAGMVGVLRVVPASELAEYQ